MERKRRKSKVILHSYCYRTGDAFQSREERWEIHIIERNKRKRNKGQKEILGMIHGLMSTYFIGMI